MRWIRSRSEVAGMMSGLSSRVDTLAVARLTVSAPSVPGVSVSDEEFADTVGASGIVRCVVGGMLQRSGSADGVCGVCINIYLRHRLRLHCKARHNSSKA